MSLPLAWSAGVAAAGLVAESLSSTTPIPHPRSQMRGSKGRCRHRPLQTAGYGALSRRLSPLVAHLTNDSRPSNFVPLGQSWTQSAFLLDRARPAKVSRVAARRPSGGFSLGATQRKWGCKIPSYLSGTAIGPAHKIIQCHAEIIRKDNQALKVRVSLALFIIMIRTHSNPQFFRQILLRDLLLFAQILETNRKIIHTSPLTRTLRS